MLLYIGRNDQQQLSAGGWVGGWAAGTMQSGPPKWAPIHIDRPTVAVSVAVDKVVDTLVFDGRTLNGI